MNINSSIKQLEKVEANIARLYRIWNEIYSLIPNGVAFFVDEDENYDELCRSFMNLYESLPQITNWKPEIYLPSLNDIARMRLNSQEYGDIEDRVSVDEQLLIPKYKLDEYKFKFKTKRTEFLRLNVLPLIETVNNEIRNLTTKYPYDIKKQEYCSIPDDEINRLKEAFKSIDVLLGSIGRPKKWSDMARHISFHNNGDIYDIKEHDWPIIVSDLDKIIYSEYDPLPIDINDLDEVLNVTKNTKIVTELDWKKLSDEGFERLIFCIITNTPQYEKAQWLTLTNAPDRGRDLSVLRLYKDELAGLITQRVIIQCKHWLRKSISIPEIASLKEQMKLWTSPKVDVCIIATSGRFTTDVIDYIEKHNESDSSLKIEMWSSSHLEMILAKHPELIAEFGLRK